MSSCYQEGRIIRTMKARWSTWGVAQRDASWRDIWYCGAHYVYCANDTHPTTFSFGVVSRTMGLDCNIMRHVVFSDKSRNNLSSDANRVRVWRSRGEYHNLAFALQRQTAVTAGLMVWVAIAYDTRSLLLFIQGTMTTQWYVHDILPPYVLPLMTRLTGALFQQDNALSRTATKTHERFHHTTMLFWPVRTSDLLPIEHF
ncbi:transposable element Tcb2 transposase [Trichonephila clavipes]|nr:transposable element Tcb2 transposase [Trichonephila clavipes]